MSSFDTAALTVAMAKIATQMDACTAELNEADGRLGDGDLGITMSRGMASIVAELPNLPQDFGMALFACAKCFTQISGSSYGTLLATGLMAAAKQCKGKEKIAGSEIAGLIEVALTAMMQRGQGKLGDKTVLDTLAKLQEQLTDIDDSRQLATAAKQAAHASLDEFREQQSQLGRARMYGEKSIGVDDPGMLALTRVVESLTN